MIRTKWMVSFILAAACAASVSSCQNDSAEPAPQEAVASAPARSAPAAPKPMSQAPLPPPPPTWDAPADEPNWDAYLQTLPTEDRTHLEAVSARYFDTLHYGNAAEQAALVRLGTPLPEEWLAARRMSDADLRARALGGDRKAAIFYLDRLISNMEALTAEAGARNFPEVVYTSNGEDRKWLEKLKLEGANRATGLLAAQGTPFTAYQAGVAYATAFGVTNTIPAGMAMAGELGDPRAAKLLEAYAATPNRDNPEDVAETLDLMRVVVARGK